MSTPFTPSNGGSQIVTPGSGGDSFSTGSDISRVLPRQLSTGSTRGTQTVGYGNVQIDGSNNRITLGDTLGNDMTIGNYSNSSNSNSISQGFGLSIVDSDNSFITLGVNSANKSAEMIFNDSQTNRLLIGKNYLGDEVVWISPPGIDVTSANPNQPGQLIFNSNEDLFKIVKKGTSIIPSFTIGTGQAHASFLTIPHGLPYAPLVNVYVAGSIVNLSFSLVASSYIPLPIFISTGAIQYYFTNTAASPSSYPLTILYGVDANNLYIQAYDGGATTTIDTIAAIPVTYFFLQETAA